MDGGAVSEHFLENTLDSLKSFSFIFIFHLKL